MKIAATQYTLKDRAFEIYFSGCNFHCSGCHNPELWDFNFGEEFNLMKMAEIYSKIEYAGDLVTSIRLLGGEPLHQDIGILYAFVSDFKTMFPIKKIVLFTGYDLYELRKHHSLVFNLFDEIKYGRYDETKRIEGEFLASSNQGIWKKNEEDR